MGIAFFGITQFHSSVSLTAMLVLHVTSPSTPFSMLSVD